MFSLALWIYRRVWICFVIRICQGFEYAKDTDGSEYAWVCTWIMLKYAWICLKQNLKSLYKLRSIYRDRGIQNPAKNLKWSKKERLAKTNYSLELLRHYKNIWQGCKYRRTFECSTNLKVLNKPQIMNISGFRICQGS